MLLPQTSYDSDNTQLCLLRVFFMWYFFFRNYLDTDGKFSSFEILSINERNAGLGQCGWI